MLAGYDGGVVIVRAGETFTAISKGDSEAIDDLIQVNSHIIHGVQDSEFKYCDLQTPRHDPRELH